MKKKLPLIIIFLVSFMAAKPSGYIETLVVNPDGSDKDSWGEGVSAKDLYIWGRTQGVYLLPDRAPLRDNYAALIHRDGTKIKIRNLNPGRRYFLHLDIAAFRNPDKKNISSRLEVTVRSAAGSRLLADRGFFEGGSDPFPVLPVPYAFTHTGSIEIILREMSNRKVSWAVWDMILSTGRQLPPVIKIPKTKKRLEIRDRLRE